MTIRFCKHGLAAIGFDAQRSGDQPVTSSVGQVLEQQAEAGVATDNLPDAPVTRTLRILVGMATEA